MAKEAPTSLKRAFCTHCKTEDELSRIFFVNPDAEVCYCPNCMSELKPKEAIDEYNYFISTKINKANVLLYCDTRFYDAYCAYAHIIEVDPSNISARFGRIISLLYMSTLRKTHFNDATLLLEREAEEFFRKMKEQGHYAKFLSKCLTAVEEYTNRFERRIMTRERLYSANCVELYFTRLYEIIEFRRYINNELGMLLSKNEDEKIQRVLSNSEVLLKELEIKFNKRVATTSGHQYKVAHVINAHQILISRTDSNVHPITRFVKYKLSEDEKNGRLIEDKVFPDNSHLMMIANVSIALMIISFVLVAICALFYVFKWFDLKIIPLIVGCAFIGSAITFIILLINAKIKMNKRRHLID